jgi:RNA-directed DNA polymerase
MNTNAPSPEYSGRRSILDLTHGEARTFLLKPEGYCSLDLPPYIVFGDLINGVHQVLDGKKLTNFRQSNPRDHDDVNYTLLHNKDGKYAWRPLQLIHPALYVSLVHAITEEDNWKLIHDRFREFAVNDKIRGLSLPVVSFSDEKDRAEQVSHWWHEVEQRSSELSLDYDYLIETDITDCYGAIYTHSIAWALHTKSEAKKKENRTNQNLIGNVIDSHIQDMRYGQTNGIPQGSVLMDLIAEMVLGLADLELSEGLQDAGITDYQMLRYRDDYRVFVNSPQVGEAIVKLITEKTTGLGLKLSSAKTKASNDIVRASIKSDKMAWMARKQSSKSLQKHLLIIHDHATNFPNTGSLVIALNDYHKRVLRLTSLSEIPQPLIAIVVDIAYRNPRTYAICAAILSMLLSFIESNDERLAIAERIRKKFSQIPNTGHMQIWLQRPVETSE